MKNQSKEKYKLPLTLKYIENFKRDTSEIQKAYNPEYIECKEYQTNFLMREKPVKHLTRLL